MTFNTILETIFAVTMFATLIICLLPEHNENNYTILKSNI